MRHSWTPADLISAVRVLGRHGSVREALPELGGITGSSVTANSIGAAFRNAKPPLESPSRYLAGSDTAPPPDDDGPPTMRQPVDPVARHEARDAAARDRRERDQLVELLREARARQEFLDAMAEAHATPQIMPRERSSGIRELVAVVNASDWHVEETVTPESVAGVNEYNLTIADARITRFFRSAIWNVEHHRASGRLAIRDMVLWLGGDLITGYIHEEGLEANGLSPTETLLWLQPRLRDGIATLLEVLQLERLIVPCSYGNHGRTTPKRRVSTGYANSFEWLLYNVLASEFRSDPRVQFEITPSAHQYVDVFGKTLHYHHGDELKYGGGVGGVGIPLLKRVPHWDLVKRAHVHNIGHFHQLLDYGRAVVNGSLIGYNSYAQSIGASPEPPQQALYFMDSKRGKCLTTALWVD